MAYHDPLTGLANRNKLEQFINQILMKTADEAQGLALLFLDLDHFKKINDSLGHEAGDQLLQIVAERLQRAVRHTDVVARLGGDEFVLVIVDSKQTESIALIAQDLLQSILQVIRINGQDIYISTSIGISFYPDDGESLPSLMKNADLALYRAKEYGRNNYQFYTMEMTSKAYQKLALQHALTDALANDEFLLHYQPIMNIQTQRITGIEALLRWKNAEYVMISTTDIIALAEETGLIIPVNTWVIKTACQQLKAWHDMGLTTLTIAVNCSERQFKQAIFVEEVVEILNTVQLPPASLEIELTESIIMAEPENSLRVLYALKDIGVQIAIDNFGTGYWSLNNLKRLSVDKIKIDKSFIKQLVVDETSTAITSAIIAMANKLGIKSVAEGVETREQYEFLMHQGCSEIQGYYLMEPQASPAMTTFLKRHMLKTEDIL